MNMWDLCMNISEMLMNRRELQSEKNLFGKVIGG